MHTGDYQEFAASPALDPFIECFWTHAASARGNPIVPDACIDIVFSQSSGLQIAGTMTRPLIAPSARELYAGVRFRPGMARAFLDAPAPELVDKVLPLTDAWGKRGRALEEQLRNTSGAEEIVEVFESALKPPGQSSPVQNALACLARNAGSIPLNEIARHAGLGERQLRRCCLAETGIAPKQFARIARFRRACCSIHARSCPDWAGLALGCGYYDQAHFIHEFEKFSGSTPGEYVRFLQYC